MNLPMPHPLTDYPLTLPFDEITIPSNGRAVVTLHVPVDLKADRVVLPRVAPSTLRVSRIRCGIQILAENIEAEQFASLEGQGPIAAFVARVGQCVALELENLTDTPQTLSGAFLRGTGIPGRFVLDATIQSLRDRGRALESSEDTRVYARGWMAALEALWPAGFYTQ